MFIEIKNLLTDAEVAHLTALAAKVAFEDGRATNSGFDQKHNLQVDPNDGAFAESATVVTNAFARSRAFQDFAFPRRLAPPRLARYEPGMRYGPHADAAYMAVPGGALRSDVSCTVFLSDPRSYEGGELVLHLGVRAMPLKAEAGSAILYPSTTLHEVAPVRSGVRLVSLTFIESRIPDEQERAIVFELGEVSALEGAAMSDVGRMRLEVVRQNLTRKWSR
ncbi:MAG: Fe2+-dependent dioxygenase [Alphaproteobacteria bacterium]|nr:Fe2+-dependent dioxygenase [Alphaproteobacteria bacterium]